MTVSPTATSKSPAGWFDQAMTCHHSRRGRCCDCRSLSALKPHCMSPASAIPLTRAHTHIHGHAHARTHKRTHTHTHKHTHTHTYTHAHRYTVSNQLSLRSVGQFKLKRKEPTAVSWRLDWLFKEHLGDLGPGQQPEHRHVLAAAAEDLALPAWQSQPQSR